MARHYKSFKLDPYPCTLRVYIDREAFESDIGADSTGMGAATYRNNGVFAVFIPVTEQGRVSIKSAAHEAYHVADWLMEHVEMEYKHGSGNEHVAYLVGHVCECIATAADKLSQQKQEAN